jgi:hypothetical protein
MIQAWDDGAGRTLQKACVGPKDLPAVEDCPSSMQAHSIPVVQYPPGHPQLIFVLLEIEHQDLIGRAEKRQGN